MDLVPLACEAAKVYRQKREKTGIQIFFQDLWADVTHGARNDGPKNIKLTTVDIWVVYFTCTLTQTLVCIYVY